jgi:hypothetical protein
VRENASEREIVRALKQADASFEPEPSIWQSAGSFARRIVGR